MSRRRSNRSTKLADEADVEYTIEMPFHNRDAKILLIDRDDEIEVIVGNIPTPIKYDFDRNYPEKLEDEETMRAHVVAQWIITETTQIFSAYDWKKSYYKSNNPIYDLHDIYFTCERSELDNAVLIAKKFLTDLEERTLKHAREFDAVRDAPSEHFK